MKLKLAEIAQLFEELNGKLLNSETGERSKGVLSHKLSVKVKYILVNELNMLKNLKKHNYLSSKNLEHKRKTVMLFLQKKGKNYNFNY